MWLQSIRSRCGQGRTTNPLFYERYLFRYQKQRSVGNICSLPAYLDRDRIAGPSSRILGVTIPLFTREAWLPPIASHMRVAISALAAQLSTECAVALWSLRQHARFCCQFFDQLQFRTAYVISAGLKLLHCTLPLNCMRCRGFCDVWDDSKGDIED